MASRKKKRAARTEAAKSAGAGAGLLAEAPESLPAPQPPAKEPLADSRSRFAWYGFVLTLLLGVLWTLGHTYMVDSITVSLCRQADPNIPNPADRPPVFLAQMAFDGYVWNRHAEQLGEDGRLRLRFTDLDNAPHGREVHWNSAFAWYLRGLGELRGLFVKDTLLNNIARMSIWANPILLTLTLVVFGTLAARRFGPLCGTVVVVGMITTPSFYEGFLPAYPDHHGIISFTLLGLAFGMAWAGAGWVQPADGAGFAAPRSMRQARVGVILSAVCGAAGLWFSALSTGIALGTVGAGVLVATWFFRRHAAKSGCVFHPELLRLWAWVGAGLGLALYLLEYFPWYLSMRLEVNHPLYPLAWIGGGFILATLCDWVASPVKQLGGFPWKRLILPALACAALPAVIVLGDPSVYIPKDPFMARLWSNIAELLPMLLRIQLGTLSWMTAFGFYPLLVLLGAVLLLLPRVDGASKVVILSMIVPIFLITALQFYQTRWGMLAGPTYIALAGLVVPIAWKQVRGHGLATPLAATAMVGYAVLLGYPTFAGWIMPTFHQYRMRDKLQLDPHQALHLLHRDMVKIIRHNAAGKPVVLLSSPNSSCILATMGGFQTIGTLYWENVDGLKAAAAALNAQSDEEALEHLRKLGVTHVSLMTWENFIEPYFHILHPKPAPGMSVANSFGQRALFADRLPVWARPIPFPEHPLAKALNQKVLLLEIVPDQTIEDAKLHVARYLRASGGDLTAAERFLRDALRSQPDNIEAGYELAEVLVAQGAIREALRHLRELDLKAAPERRRLALERFIPLFSQKGAGGEAVGWLKESAEREDAATDAIGQAVWILSTSVDPSLRDPSAALALSERLAGADSEVPMAARAVALGANGRFDEAAALADRVAQSIGAAGGDTIKIERMRRAAEAFRRNEAWIDGR